MRRWAFSCLLFALLVLCASCGDDDDDESSPCDPVCACVHDHGGDVNVCYDECAQTIRDGGNQRASCLIKLGLYGLAACNATCDAFPTSS
jgi:hypothetical protein